MTTGQSVADENPGAGARIVPAKRKCEEDAEQLVDSTSRVNDQQDEEHADEENSSVQTAMQMNLDKPTSISQQYSGDERANELLSVPSASLYNIGDPTGADNYAAAHGTADHNVRVHADAQVKSEGRVTAHGTRMPNGDIAYFKPSFIEDPWEGLEPKPWT